MVEDNNVRGAVPARTLNASCLWAKNRGPALFYVCIIVRLQYHRADDELRLYLNVMGSATCATRRTHPSSASRRGGGGGMLLAADGARDSLLSGEFVTKVSMSEPSKGIQYHRGYLSFHAAYFQRPGT